MQFMRPAFVEMLKVFFKSLSVLFESTFGGTKRVSSSKFSTFPFRFVLFYSIDVKFMSFLVSLVF